MSTPRYNLDHLKDGILPTDANGIPAAGFITEVGTIGVFALPQSNAIAGMPNILPRDKNNIPVLGGMAPDGSVVPLHARDLSGGHGGITGITVDGITIIGSGTALDPFRIKISSKPGNALRIITGSLDPAEDGLFVEARNALEHWDDTLFWNDTDTWEDR